MKKLELIKTMNENTLINISNFMNIFINEVENEIIPMDEDFIKIMDILVKAISDSFKIKYNIRCIENSYENGKISEETFNNRVNIMADITMQFSDELFKNCYEFSNKMIGNI